MKENYVWATNQRVIEIISLIVLHVSGPVLSKYATVTDGEWLKANIFDSIVRFCVPVF